MTKSHTDVNSGLGGQTGAHVSADVPQHLQTDSIVVC